MLPQVSRDSGAYAYRVQTQLATEIDAHVGSRLRARRLEVGLSQGALAEHLGLTFSQVQKYEKGSNRLGAGRLYLVAAFLGVPIQYFFEGLDRSSEICRASEAKTATRVDYAQYQATFERITDPYARKTLLALARSMAEGK